MQVGQYVDHHVTDAAIKSRVIGELFWQLLTDDGATSPLHDVKIDTEYGGVCTQGVTTGCQREDLAEPREYAVLTLHVVRTWCNRAERRTPKHVLARTELQQVSQVGVSASELSQREGTRGVR